MPTRMICARMYHQNGDLANLLKSARKKSAPECRFEYSHIFSNSELEQKAVAALFLCILESRQLLIREGLPGAITLDPPLYL